MYAPGGVAYVYFVYGIHHCVNVVASVVDSPQAVLVRAIEPLAGIELMRTRRGAAVPEAALARGPGNLTRAFAIDRSLNGADLRRGPLRLLVPPRGSREPRDRRAETIARSPRIGVDYAGEWASRPWRFFLRGNPSVSRAMSP
jgi:DNA-3-methyladenine glycosylase